MSKLPDSDLFAVPLPKGFLLFSPRRRLAVRLNRQALMVLFRIFVAGDHPSGLSPEMDALVAELSQPQEQVIPSANTAVSPPFLGLITTRACNLACAYCAFGSRTSPDERMLLATAVAAVDWMAHQARRLARETLDIHFFGGEPFAAPEVVDTAVLRGRIMAEQSRLRPHFEASTNGYYTADQADFIGAYFHAVVVSIDGPAPVHDRHRPAAPGKGSFDRVAETIQRLGRWELKLCLRVCVSKENVASLEEIVSWLGHTFRPSVINLETLQPTPESVAAGLRPPDPAEFAVHGHRAIRQARSQGIKAVYSAAEMDGPRYTFCPVGRDTIIVSPDGQAASCYLPRWEWKQRDLELEVGRVDGANLSVDSRAIRRVRRAAAHKPRCRRCFCRWTCAGGCLVNQTWPGCPDAYDDFCRQTRLLSACALLDAMGDSAEADGVLTDARAMAVLAEHADDRLENFPTMAGGHG